MNTITTSKIRSRAWPYLNGPHVAAAVGMSLSELQNFCLRAYNPTEDQLKALCGYFNLRCA